MSGQPHVGTPGPTGSPIDVLRDWARLQPDARAFSFVADDPGDARAVLTYAGLDLQARALAVRLVGMGLRGERAVLLFPPGLDFVVAFFGCLYAGVVAVPASPGRPNRPNERLRAILEDARPGVVITPRVAPVGRDGLPHLGLNQVEKGWADDWRPPDSGSATLAFLQYTSGSTATPKGVMVTLGNLAHNSRAIADCFGTSRESRGVFWLPTHHDMGLIGGILQTVHCGGGSVLLSPSAFLQRPRRWLELVSETGAAISGGPNFAYDLCARKAETSGVEGLDLSRWRVAFNGAEPIRAETLDRFAHAFAPAGFRREAFLPCYGMAETTLLVSGTPWNREPLVIPVDAKKLERGEIEPSAVLPRPLVGCGRVSEGMRAVIVDPVTDRPVSTGRVGEIWVSGPSVAAGYWGNAEATARSFGARLDGHPGPFLRTGDLGFLRDGELFVTGRIKDLIIIRGRNHYPQDLEWTAQQAHPALRADAAAAFPLEVDGEERIALVLEIERHAKDQVDAAFAAIRRAVAGRRGVEVHAIALIRPMSLPRTTSGKVRRGACREQFLAGTLDVVASSVLDAGVSPAAGPIAVIPRSTAEIREWLSNRLGSMTGIEASRVGPRREFASFGLGSLQAASLAGELEEWLGRPLAPTLVYDYPTIVSLAAHLGESIPNGETDGRMIENRPEENLRSSIAHPSPDHREPIAIIGIGCRFPGADGPDAFWRLLAEGGDAVHDWPEGRRGGRVAGRRGGFLAEVDEFDADFFGIPAREAARIDPQHRLLLEVAWEALEDAGQVPEHLGGSPVGVFVGISTNDYALLQAGRDGPGDAFALTGNASSVAANRISYLFDFRGPSLAVDSACSSSLTAVHLACQAIRSGEASLALAGGVNLTLSGEVWEKFERAGFLAADGLCKTFDAKADGYVRGEGAGLVVLKPLSAATADGDPIRAVIRGGAINQDGRTNGLTAPSRWAQEAVVTRACRAAGVDPASLDYVEAHGTGTLLGDPIEAAALGAVVGHGRPADRPCVVGSAKTNIGHLEAAAGVAGLVKVALALEHRAIPPSLHFIEPNPHISFDDLHLRVARSLEPWPTRQGPPRAGISSFGFGGGNAHLVLEGVERPAESKSEVEATGFELVPLSARGPEALVLLARSFRDFFADSKSECLREIAACASVRRGHHDHRIALLVDSKAAAIAALGAYLEGRLDPGLRVAHDPSPSPRPMVEGGRAERLEALATRYVQGIDVEWRVLYPSARFVKLPPHPWLRARHWFDAEDAAAKPERAGKDAGDWRERPEPDRRAWLIEFLRDKVAEAMKLPVEEVEADRPLDSLELDSLTAFEINWAVDDGLKVQLPASSFVEGMSVAGLADAILARIFAPSDSLDSSRDLEDSAENNERRPWVATSSQQSRLWFLAQLEPASPAYSITSALRLLGEVDVPALTRALGEVARRHEALRTTFDAIDGRPVRIIADSLELPMPAIDLSSLPGASRDREIASKLAEEAGRPFDLAAGPLVRAWLLRLGTAEHVVVLNLHHIVADGLSMAILIRELATLYQVFIHDRPSPLPTAPRYADYVTWQAERSESDRFETELDYWRRQLAGVPALELPTDRPRALEPTRRAGTQRLTLPKSLTRHAVELGRTAGATPFMTLLAAFHVLLHRSTGQVDLAVGTPIAGRPGAEFASTVGLFVNSLVLRVDLAGDPDFLEVIARVRRVAIEAYSRQDVPFEQVVAAIQPDRTSGHSPLFQVMFVFQDDPFREIQTPGLKLVPMEVEAVAAKFDLTLFATETGDGLALRLEYDADLFDAATIDRMLAHYRGLLESAVEDPRQPVADLPMLTPAERHLLLREWNATRVEYPTGLPAHRLFERQAARTPEAVAVAATGGSLTYRELDERSNRLAHHLRGLGVGPDGLVGVCLPRSVELVVGLLGVLKAGGAYLPLDPAYPAGRIAGMIEDSSARVLLADSDLIETMGDHSARVVLADEAADSPATPLDGGESLDHLAYVIYTSGSTGRPKGAMITHRGLANYLNWSTRAYPVGGGRGAPVHSSISFDLTVTSLFAPLLSGGRADLLAEDLGIEALADALRREGDYSLVKITPAHLQLLGQQLAPEQAAGRTRAFVVGGEQLTGEHMAFWLEHAPGTAIVNEYGPTETVVGCCVDRVDASNREIAGAAPIGRPIANTRLYVLDPRMRPMPIGSPGELFIGGEGVARGYLNRPALTAERFVPDPFGPPGSRLYRSGDRARWRGDGRLEFLGRADDQVKIRGYRVELGEVEAALAALPEIREAAVVSIGEGPGDRQLVGYVSGMGGRETIDPAEVRRDLALRLPGYMIPATIVVLDALPLTPNGKVDRASLPEPKGDRISDRHDRPTGPVEETLGRIVAEVMKLEDVAAHGNLFDLGIDSISIIQVVSKARAAGIRLQPAQLFRHQTVAELARAIERFEADPVDPAPIPIPQPASRRRHDASPRQDQDPGSEIEDRYPLSPTQEGILFDAAYADGTGAYVQQMTCTLRGELDSRAFADAWRAVVARHPILRTAFQWVDADRPKQVVYRQVDPPISELDWRDLPPETRQDRFESHLLADRERGFVTSWPPLFRLALIRLEPGLARMVLTFHHAILDGWCMPLLFEEVLTLYRASLLGEDVSLPIRRPYRDYIAWLGRRDTSKAEAYWRGSLRGFRTPTAPGIDRRPGVVDRGFLAARGERIVRLGVDPTAALVGLARSEQVTLNTIAQGAWAVLLARYNGQTDVVFGTTVSGRQADLDGIEAMIGLFINTLPTRVLVDEGAILGPWLRRLQVAQASMREHEATPLVDIQGWTEVPRGRPLFETILVFENYPIDVATEGLPGGLRFEEPRVFEATNFPITLMVVPNPELTLRVDYDAGRFEAEAIDRLLGHYRTLLEAMAADPARRLADLPMIGRDEQARLLNRGGSLDLDLEAQDERELDLLLLRLTDGDATDA